MKGCSFRFFFLIISEFILPALCFIIFTGSAQAQNSDILAGFRASRIPSSYPNNEFPNEDYWIKVGEGISQKFEDSSPSSIWLISLYQDNGETRLGFPSDGNNYSNILFSDFDMSEEYLSRFDAEGFKIFLQIEPGDADINTLINIVLSRYGHHPCIAGFGIDVEWLNPVQNSDGRKVTDEEAERWEKLVKSFNPSYKFFLKHYFYEWMPPNYRGDILFVDDGQQFSSLGSMLIYFKQWADHFKGSIVAFQYGYTADEFWWSLLPDPSKTIGNFLLENISNVGGLFWVDFSVTSIFPLTPTSINNEIPVNDFKLNQNYPNPFNPTTKIKYTIPSAIPLLRGARGMSVELKVYDVLGNEIATLVNEEKNPGDYEVVFNAESFSSGTYFYKLTARPIGQAGNYSEVKKMILLR